MRINIEGIDELTRNLSKYSKETEKNIEKGLAAGIQKIVGQAKAAAPVDTGSLRDSIYGEAKGKRAEAVSPAEYSIYQEFGTRYMTANPYMIPAMKSKKDEVIDDVRKAIGGKL